MTPPPAPRHSAGYSARVSARVSAVHACLERLGAAWEERDGALRALHFGDAAAEAATAPVLGLADRGALPRIGLTGPGAVAWARTQGVAVPTERYGWTRAVDGTLAVRVGQGELFLEGAGAAAVAAALAAAPPAACWPVRREDAALLLCGRRAPDVLAQTCAYDFRGAAGRFVMTRVALVSCAVLADRGEAMREEDAPPVPVYHLWAAPSYGPWLWDELLTIVRECGGGPVGELAAAALLPARPTERQDEGER